MLDSTFKEQLRTLSKELKHEYTFDAVVSSKHPQCNDLKEILNDIASCSEQIHCTFRAGDGLQFTLLKDGENTRISFRSTPNGSEFTSLIMAIVNCEGKGKNLPDEAMIKRIEQLNGPIRFTTYVNLNCTICPETVQLLNAVTMYNDQIYHETVDGSINKLEVIEREVMVLPTVYANDSFFMTGKTDYPTLIEKLEANYGTR